MVNFHEIFGLGPTPFNIVKFITAEALMYRQQFYIIANLFIALDAIILISTGYMAYSTAIELRSDQLAMARNNLIGSLIFLVFANNYLMGRFGFYSDRRFPSNWFMARKLLMAVLLSFTFLAAGAILLRIQPFSRHYLVIHFSMAVVLLTIARVILYHYLDRRSLTAFNSRNILITGTEKRIMPLIDALQLQRSWGHHIAGWINVAHPPKEVKNIPILGTLKDFDRILREYQIDEVIFDLPRDYCIDLGKYLNRCEAIGVAFRIVPGFFHIEHPTLKAENIQGIPTLATYNETTSASSLLYKKILDILIGSIGFATFLVIYPFVSLAIKLESPGPTLFKQVRIGLNGRRFYLYKFRSMIVDAESKKEALLINKEAPWPIYKCEHDPRITKVGRFLRKSSLDEFPQFINVLKGEMSLVGTRPPTPEEVKNYNDWHRRRISMKPGLTGLWQISGRKEIKDFTEVVRLDLKYIDNYRFKKDLVILWKTIWTVIARKGAK